MMIRRSRIAVAIMAILVAGAAVNAQQSVRAQKAFWKNLSPGPYVVGFRVLYQRDARKWHDHGDAAGDAGRPLRVSVWYPATPGAASHPLVYGDYLHYEGPPGFQELNGQLERDDKESWLSDLADVSSSAHALFDALLKTPVAAYGDAPAARGHFPLVLYSSGKRARSDAGVEIGEYLASHGYVVVTVPQLGISAEQLELGSSPQEITLHAQDLEAALAAVHTFPDIDFSRIATAGHSAGGEVAVELAMRDPSVKAVIGLDGSYGMTEGVRVFRQLPGYAPGKKMTAVLLDLRRAEGAQQVKLDLATIDGMQWADSYRVTFAHAFHGDFTEWGILGRSLSVPMPANPDGHTREMGYEANQHVFQAALDFLDWKLGGQPSAHRQFETITKGSTDMVLTHAIPAT